MPYLMSCERGSGEPLAARLTGLWAAWRSAGFWFKRRPIGRIIGVDRPLPPKGYELTVAVFAADR